MNESTPASSSNTHTAATVRVPLDYETAHGEIIGAAREFVASTSWFRRRKESRESFERLALALLALDQRIKEANR